MKKILFAGLVMICISATASAQKVTDKPVQKDRIEKTFKKGDGHKFDKSRFGKDGVRHQMWNRHGRKDGIGRKNGKRKMYVHKHRKSGKSYPFRNKGNRQNFKGK